jgi:hypothetical protein
MGPLALKRSVQCSSVGGSTEGDTLLYCRTTSLLGGGAFLLVEKWEQHPLPHLIGCQLGVIML